MVADGMSMGTLTLADYVIRRDRGTESNWVKLNAKRGAVRSWQNTASLNAPVTDSAAAASSWGGGQRVNNGSINVTPKGKQLLPILVQARQAGKMTGCVTTTRITHATPAGFFANVPYRDMEDQIALDLLTRGIDVAMGGGAKHFKDADLKAQAGLTVVRTRQELLAAGSGGRLLGLFDTSHVPFVLDRTSSVPGLVDMARAALSRLEKGRDGFVLQIEAGRVDHAAHANDAPSLVAEQVEFDDAIGAVLGWMQDRDDTLLIVTSDHGNANPGLTSFKGSGAEGMARLSKAKQSYEWIENELEKHATSDDKIAAMSGLVERAMGVRLADDDMALLGGSMTSPARRVSPFREANKWTSVLGGVLADHFGVSFMSPNHTADLVELSATGPGSELVPGYVENHQLHSVMVSALGLPDGKMLEGMDQPMLHKGKVKDD